METKNNAIIMSNFGGFMIGKQQKILLGVMIGISTVSTHASWKNYAGLGALVSATLYAGYKAIILHNTQRTVEQAIHPIVSAVDQNNVITISQKETLNTVKPLTNFQDYSIWLEEQNVHFGDQGPKRTFIVYKDLNDLIAGYNQGEKKGKPKQKLQQELALWTKPIQVKKYWATGIAACLCAASAYVAYRLDIFKK